MNDVDGNFDYVHFLRENAKFLKYSQKVAIKIDHRKKSILGTKNKIRAIIIENARIVNTEQQRKADDEIRRHARMHYFVSSHYFRTTLFEPQ